MRSLLVANLKIMVRDRQAIFWALAFPIMLVMVFGVFDLDNVGSADLALIDNSNSDLSRELGGRLSTIEYLNIHRGFSTVAEAQDALDDGDLEYILVIPDGVEDVSAGDSGANGGQESSVGLDLFYDTNERLGNQLVVEAISHFVDEQNLKLIGRPPLLNVIPQRVESDEIEYFDILLIGLVGMGMMTNSIIFIAVKISVYRNQSILKRIRATPLRVSNYFASEIVAHLLLTIVQAAAVIGLGVFVFGATIRGNILWLFIIIAFANTIFLNIGFIISAWANSPRAASGMGNAVVIPMMFFSGTFFSTTNLPSFLPHLVQVLPLTPMLDAMRGVAIDEKALWQVWPQLAMLAGWLAASSLAAVKVFKFA